MKSPTHDTGYEYGLLALLCMGFGFIELGHWLIVPLFPRIMHDLDLDYWHVAILTTVYTLAYGFGSLVTGPVSDWFGRKKLLIGALPVLALLSGLTGLASSFPALLAFQFVTSVAAGVLIPIGIAAASEASAPTRRGLNLGLLLGMLPLFGLCLAPVEATLLLRIMPSWRWAFAVPAIWELIIAGLLLAAMRPGFHAGRRASANASDASENNTRGARAKVHTHPRPVRWFSHLCSRNVWLGALASCCTVTGIVTMGAMVPSYLIEELHLDIRNINFVMSAMGAGGFFSFLVPTLSDYFGRRPMAVASFIISALLVHAFRTIGPNPLLLCVSLFVIAFFVYGILALMVGPIAAEGVPPGMIASSVGLVFGGSQIFGCFLPIFPAIIARHSGFGAVLWFIICALISGAVVSFFLVETAPRKNQPVIPLQPDSTEQQ